MRSNKSIPRFEIHVSSFTSIFRLTVIPVALIESIFGQGTKKVTQVLVGQKEYLCWHK
jgi:hypothetical protein